jgi:trehalose 6-phosphate synthase
MGADSGERVDKPLILLSNRGPATFERDSAGELTPRRGGGGLVTALTGLLRKREAIWIASAMTPEDTEVSRRHGERAFDVDMEHGRYRIRLVSSDPDAYDGFYNVIANPLLWFIQHYLWDLSNVPDVRMHERIAWRDGYKAVNGDLARAVLEEIEHLPEPIVMIHDYHFYTCPAIIRSERPDAFLHHFVHIPWTAPDAWRVLPADMRREIFEGLLANDIIGFHTRPYCNNFLQCCRELMSLDTDFKRGAVLYDGREILVRPYPLAIDEQSFTEAAASEGVRVHEQEILRRRRDHLILRVDRADLSKNVLRGFSAFDIFLEQHPEFSERVTFVAHLQPSRQDVPEYVEYLEKIEALVAVVNHRHGTPDWMPIDLRLRDDFDEAVALYKHFDLLLVNAMWDGMNLVSKEGPLINTRDGMMILSENTGAHEELGECALSVNPFDVQEQADAMYEALTATPEVRAKRMRHLRGIIAARTPEDWIEDQLADIDAKRAGDAPFGVSTPI